MTQFDKLILMYILHNAYRQFVKIDRFFPSSKMCSSYGGIKQDLTLSIRECPCESCREISKEHIKARK